MRVNFFKGSGQQMKGDFSNGPCQGQHMGRDSLNGPGRTGKREMSFPTGEAGYKQKKTNNIVS